MASWRSWTVCSSPWRLPNQATAGRSGSNSAPVGTPSTRPMKLPSTGTQPTATRSSGFRLQTRYHTMTLPPAAYRTTLRWHRPTIPGHADEREPPAGSRVTLPRFGGPDPGKQEGTTRPGGEAMGVDDKAKNKAQEVKGQAKEGLGRATDDQELEAEGRTDQAKSDLKQAGEQVKDAFKD